MLVRIPPLWVGVAALTLAGVTVATAADVVWINSAGGRWADGANWNMGEAPMSTDRAILPALAAPYTVVVGGQRTVSQLSIENSDATLAITGDSVSGNANLTVSSGVINSGRIELTSTAVRSAALTVSSGSLRNELGGEIRLTAAAGGARTLSL